MAHENRRQEVEAYLATRQEWMQDAVEVMGAERTTNPLDVFPSPTEPRDAAPDPNLNEDQEAKLREVAGRFGIGGEVSVIDPAPVQIIEGGKPWKVEAEAEIAEGAKTIVYAGSPHRLIGQDEADYMAKKFGADLRGRSELDTVRELIQQQAGFVALDTPQPLPYGYDIDDDHSLLTEGTGQLVRVGTQADREVLLLRVDRENYTDEEGKNKYRKQPDSAAIMQFVGEVLSSEGDDSSSVGIVTSTAYASRAIDTVRAGLNANRYFAVSMYGRQVLADVKGEAAAEPTGINQIPGELHALQTKLDKLQAELES